MTVITGRYDLDAINAKAKEAHPGRAVAKAIGFSIWLVGFVIARAFGYGWMVVAFVCASAGDGFSQGYQGTPMQVSREIKKAKRAEQLAALRAQRG